MINWSIEKNTLKEKQFLRVKIHIQFNLDDKADRNHRHQGCKDRPTRSFPPFIILVGPCIPDRHLVSFNFKRIKNSKRYHAFRGGLQ